MNVIIPEPDSKSMDELEKDPVWLKQAWDTCRDRLHIEWAYIERLERQHSDLRRFVERVAYSPAAQLAPNSRLRREAKQVLSADLHA